MVLILPHDSKFAEKNHLNLETANVFVIFQSLIAEIQNDAIVPTFQWLSAWQQSVVAGKAINRKIK